MIRVVLADDQAVVRDALSLLLSASGAVEVLASVGDGEQAVAEVLAHRPDVALLDLRMPHKDGAQATAEIVAEAPEVKVLILTTYADDDAIMPALRAGAVGYLTKDVSGEELVAALRDVASGRMVLDPSVQRRLVEFLRTAGGEAARNEAAPQRVDEQPDGLTKREVDVVRLVAEGLSNQQIAHRLVVSEATVKTHLNHVLSKLGLDGRPGLVAWAWRRGLVRQ
jgi:DNA-binding NarL/FixJ family response regulator